jgi:hypothetical protein
VFDLTNLKGEKRRSVGKLNNELSIVNQLVDNLKLPIDAFYREIRSGVNIAKRNITTGLFGLDDGLKSTLTVCQSNVCYDDDDDG